jgi:hypothetical protein
MNEETDEPKPLKSWVKIFFYLDGVDQPLVTDWMLNKQSKHAFNPFVVQGIGGMPVDISLAEVGGWVGFQATRLRSDVQREIYLNPKKVAGFVANFQDSEEKPE